MGSFLLVFPSDSGIASLSRTLDRAGGAVENVVGGAAAAATPPSPASKSGRTRKGASEEWTGREGRGGK